MSEPSDWEPLPAEDLAMHPGELGRGALYERATLPPPPTFAPPPGLAPPRLAPSSKPAPPAFGPPPGLAPPHGLAPPPKLAPPSKPAQPAEPSRAVPPVEPEDPSAGRMLQALKSKLAEAGPSHSLIAEVQRRELRERRQKRAANKLADCAEVKSTLQPKDVPLDIVFTTPLPERDGRQDEDWFKRLPEVEQNRLLGVWSQQVEHTASDQPVHRRNRDERLIICLVVFAATLAGGTHGQWYATVGAGIGCGIWWRYLPPDRFTDPVTAFACFFVAQLLAWGVGGGDPPRGMFMDAILLVALASLTGFHGEIRRSGGFVAK